MSALDDRLSSKCIGGMGIAILVSVFACILACDFPRFVDYVRPSVSQTNSNSLP